MQWFELSQLIQMTNQSKQSIQMHSSFMQEPRVFTLNDFIVRQQIGVGRFGLVYRAIQKQSQVEVAIKMIIKKSISTSQLHKQLQRQLEVQSRLKHKYICELYAYFYDMNSLYIVLEYCPHGSLSAPIRNAKESFSDKKIASILKQLVQALAFMHSRNVMHRDLKLQNILFDKDYNAKISDFGWCVHNSGERKTFCGTMEYISPEMLKKQKYRHNVDMYCLGIILYEMFYFKSPFIGQTEEETFQNIKRGVVHFPDEVRVIPEPAKRLIIELLSKDPEGRPNAESLFNHDFITSYLVGNKEQLSNKERLTEKQFALYQEELKKSSVRAESDRKQHENDESMKKNKQE